MQLFEFHDQAWFPGFLRDYVTESLQAVLAFGSVYRSCACRLSRAFQTSNACRVVDLCSGGSGPWLWLQPALRDSHDRPVEICLTDLYPNMATFERIQQATHGLITYWPESVDATKVPGQLEGFRTIFSSFHHFPRREAIPILQSAVDNRQGIGIFEAARRHPVTIASTGLMFFGSLITAPFVRPFRLSRLVWTYLVPVVPFLLFWDGLMSCLRAYSTEQLQEMTASLRADGYKWDIGQDRGGFATVTYLVGWPAPGAIDQFSM